MSRWSFPPIETINPYLFNRKDYDLRDSEIRQKVRDLVISNIDFYFRTVLSLDFYKDFHLEWFDFEKNASRTLLLAPRDSLKCVHPLTLIPGFDKASYIYCLSAGDEIASVFKNTKSRILSSGALVAKKAIKVKVGHPFNFWIYTSEDHKFFCYNLREDAFEVIRADVLNPAIHFVMLSRPTEFNPKVKADPLSFDNYIELFIQNSFLDSNIFEWNLVSFNEFLIHIRSYWPDEDLEVLYPWVFNTLRVLEFYHGIVKPTNENIIKILKSKKISNISNKLDAIAFILDEESDFVPIPLQCNKEFACFTTIDSIDETCLYFDKKLEFFYDFACDNSHYIANGFVTHNSTVTTIGGVLYKALTDPEKRYAIISATGKLATGYVKKIRRICQVNSVIRYCFNDIVNPNEIQTWSSEALEFVRKSIHPEPTIWALGEGTDFTGFHFDEVHFDDMVTIRHRRSATLRRATWDWFRLTAIPALNKMGGVGHVKGTRYHWDDLYGKIIEISESSGSFQVLRNPALDEDLLNQGIAKSFWPERYSEEDLLQIRADYGEETFQLQYMCAAGAILTEKSYLDKIRECMLPVESLNSIGEFVMGVDLASKGTSAVVSDNLELKKSSFAISVVGRHSQSGKWVVADTLKVKRPLLSDQREYVQAKALQWNPLVVAIEQNAYQNVFFEYLEEGDVPVSIKPVKSFESKDARFDYIMGLVATGSLFFIEGVTQPLLDEIYTYPECTADCIDALFFAIRTGYKTPQIRFM